MNAMQKRNARFKLSYTGFFIFLALILGGGTDQALTEDFILSVLALPLIFQLFTSLPQKNSSRLFLLIASLFVLFPVLQMLPTFGLIKGPALGTLDAGRTLYSAIFMLVFLALFKKIMTMQAQEKRQLIPFFLAGVFVNFVPSFFQFGSKNFFDSIQPFSYKVNAGFMANENHLALLFVMTVPILIDLFRKTRFPLLSVPLILLLILFQMVVGSRAGILMIATAAIASYVFIVLGSRIVSAAAIVAIFAAGAYFAWHALYTPSQVDLDNFDRWTFFQNTIKAIGDHLPFGTGMGTFTLIYPQYGIETGVFKQYVNHVHNDYLELLLEGGVISAGLLVVYLVTLVVRIFTVRPAMTDLQKSALLGIGFTLLHSVVDYPLRTMAIATVFVLFNAVVFSDMSDATRRRR